MQQYEMLPWKVLVFKSEFDRHYDFTRATVSFNSEHKVLIEDTTYVPYCQWFRYLRVLRPGRINMPKDAQQNHKVMARVPYRTQRSIDPKMFL